MSSFGCFRGHHLFLPVAACFVRICRVLSKSGTRLTHGKPRFLHGKARFPRVVRASYARFTRFEQRPPIRTQLTKRGVGKAPG